MNAQAEYKQHQDCKQHQECKNHGENMHHNIQDVFLNHLRKHKVATTVFLVNGVKLQGVITGFDNFALFLRRDDHAQLVYKHAISTILPNVPVNIFESANESAGQA